MKPQLCFFLKKLSLVKLNFHVNSLERNFVALWKSYCFIDNLNITSTSSGNCCTCNDGGRVDYGWNHFHPHFRMGRSSTCCVCFEGRSSNGWDHSGASWTGDLSPNVNRENR